MSRWLTWGVDGYGVKHYLCRHCLKEFGTAEPEADSHTCKAQQIEAAYDKAGDQIHNIDECA